MPSKQLSPYWQPKDAECAALGRVFRAARARANKPLMTLASEMGCSYYIIRRHEAGHTMLRADDLVKAARLMRVPPADLLTTGA